MRPGWACPELPIAISIPAPCSPGMRKSRLKGHVHSPCSRSAGRCWCPLRRVQRAASRTRSNSEQPPQVCSGGNSTDKLCVSGCALRRRTAKEQPGATFGQAGLGPRGSLGQDDQACSFLGTVDWHATDRLTAPLGVNYTKDEKSVSTPGLEVDATWNATENLVLTFAGTFQDPVYDSFTASATGDISGTTPSGIPETAHRPRRPAASTSRTSPPSFGPTGSKKVRLATSM